MSDPNLSSFIWSVADLLRGDYKQSEYGKVILPFTVLRRLDCVLEPSKPAILKELETRTKAGVNPEPFLLKKSGQLFYNTSPLDLKKLMGDQDHIGENLRSYIQAFSGPVRDIFERFEFHTQIDRLTKAGLLYQVTEKFSNIDLHPEVVSNDQMGSIFEELIRKFAELSNETAGEHFTPREVIRLMVNLLFIEDDDALTKPGVVRSIYDPTAGTGGMLSVAGEHLHALNPKARLVMYGQELNPESYAICKADMLIKGQDIANIVFGNTLSADGLTGKDFDYMLSNPPFGVEWKKIETVIRKEYEQQGHNGRFGPGLPRVSDGSLLFLLHLISKMRPAKDGGSRLGIVLNGSPLFTGGAGSGESEIRRHLLESDLVEAIIALPTDMFYNTGISTYIWIVSNRKPDARNGKVQLIDASSYWQKMRKSLGSKRKELSPSHIDKITWLFGSFKELTIEGTPISKIFRNEDFGYRTITVEHPLRLRYEVNEDRLYNFCQRKEYKKLGFNGMDAIYAVLRRVTYRTPTSDEDFFAAIRAGSNSENEPYGGFTVSAALKKALREEFSVVDPSMPPVIKEEVKPDYKKYKFDEYQANAGIFDCGGGYCRFEADPSLRDTENVPLSEDIDNYFFREVRPHAEYAWIDHEKTKVGYEIPFNRHFYVFKPPRALSEIDAELKGVTDKILTMIQGLSA